jgi:hypothetical protein
VYPNRCVAFTFATEANTFPSTTIIIYTFNIVHIFSFSLVSKHYTLFAFVFSIVASFCNNNIEYLQRPAATDFIRRGGGRRYLSRLLTNYFGSEMDGLGQHIYCGVGD